MIGRSGGFASHFMHLIKFIIRSLDSTMDLGTFNCILRDEEDGSGAGMIPDSDKPNNSHKKKSKSPGNPKKDRKLKLGRLGKLKQTGPSAVAEQNRKKSEAELQFEYNVAIINIQRIEELLGIPKGKRIEAELGIPSAYPACIPLDSKVLGDKRTLQQDGCGCCGCVVEP